MPTSQHDLSGLAGADAGEDTGGPAAELEELAHGIADAAADAQGAAAAGAPAVIPPGPVPPAAPTPAVAAPATPRGPAPPPPSELVGSSASRTVGDTPTVVATPTSEAVSHAMGHLRADTPGGPRNVARPIFRRPRAGTTHTSGETPAAGDSRAMEARMNTEQPASHVSLGQLAREARGRARRRPQRPERSSRPSPGMGRSSLDRFLRRGK